jgi:protein ImuB
MSGGVETLALFSGEPSPRQSEAYAPGRRQHKLWIAVVLPRMALESLAEIDSDRPTVITEYQRRETRVVAANDAAIALGIEPAIGLSAAFALCDSLQLVERNADSERTRLEHLAERARQFTPVVSLAPPAALLLEVAGSLKLFGGIEALEDALTSVLQQERVTARLCAAPTATAALWLARCGQADVLSEEALPARLGALPVDATEWPASVRGLLLNMGVRTLGECMRLPRDGFARRIGQRYLQELDRARGAHDPRPDFIPVAKFEAHAEFGEETADTSLLTELGTRLIRNLVGDLQGLQMQTPGFVCTFYHPNRTTTVEHIRFAQPTSEERRFLSLFVDRLEKIRLTAPVIALGLTAEPAEPAVASDGILFSHPEDVDAESAASSLIERLQARFGTDSLYGVELIDEHRPEAAWIKSKQFLQRGRRPPLAVGIAPRRPLWLLPIPRRLPSTADSLPCYRDSQVLCIEQGPERIESGWWDGNEIARDYYIASSVDGERLWVFRDRRTGRDWYLHGFFA